MSIKHLKPTSGTCVADCIRLYKGKIYNNIILLSIQISIIVVHFLFILSCTGDWGGVVVKVLRY